jgi:VIT1/CCC1 family predicted Fe2+/Mn2+ transporter
MASLIIGVAASGASRSTILVSGVAGLVAGALAMALTACIGWLFGTSV